jgi:hypothetical protein
MAKQPFPADPSAPAARLERDTESTAGLLSRLIGEFSTLFRKEIALAKAEITEAAAHAKTGAIMLVAGVGVLFCAVLVLLAAAVLGLSEVMDPWLAALIVAIVVGVAGFLMLQHGKTQLELSSFKPERTQDALRKDKEVLQRRTS